MKRLITMTFFFACTLAAVARSAHAADPWADHVVNYVSGTVEGFGDAYTTAPFTDSSVALGSPTRITSPDNFPSAVTPLNPAFRSTEVVSVFKGGSLVVSFDEPVLNAPGNPFGIDLLIFGNSLLNGNFSNPDFTFNAAGTVANINSQGGLIEVSADNVTYFPVAGAADGIFPTNAFTDVPDPFGFPAGSIPSDFTRPVDPSFNPLGKTFAQVLAAYNGSGGGFGVDIAPTGLSSISYVRITNPANAVDVPEIDAFADVSSIPEPASAGMFFVGALILLGKFSRTGNVKAGT